MLIFKKNKNTQNIPKIRQFARCICLQALYQWHMTKQSYIDLKAQFLNKKNKQNIDQKLFTGLLQGVITHVDTLDTILIPLIKQKDNHLNPIELNILRMGTFELIYSIHIPKKVIINECIELGKKFGATDGYKYINGMMDQLVKKCEPYLITV